MIVGAPIPSLRRISICWMSGLLWAAQGGLASTPIASASGNTMLQLPLLDTASARIVAADRPCAGAALIYIHSMEVQASSGTFYLNELPTMATVTRLIDDGDDAGKDFFAQAQPNPYSNNVYFVVVRWSLRSLNSGARVLSTTAEIVNAAGSPIVPTHVLEPSTNVMIVKGSYRVMDSSISL